MIIVYEPSTGRVTQTINDPVPAGLPDVLRANGEAFISVDGEYGIEIYSDHYVNNEKVVIRPSLPVKDTEITLKVGDTYTISRLPKPCRVTVDGEEHVIEDGKLVISADMPAEYELLLSQWPYKEALVRITINEA